MIIQLEKINTEQNAGYRLALFKYISFTVLVSNIQGTHFNIAIGFYPVETSMQLSLWD